MLADRQVVAAYNASGRYETVDLPTVGEALDAFDAALLSQPSVVDAATYEYLEMLRGA